MAQPAATEVTEPRLFIDHETGAHEWDVPAGVPDTITDDDAHRCAMGEACIDAEVNPTDPHGPGLGAGIGYVYLVTTDAYGREAEGGRWRITYQLTDGRLVCESCGCAAIVGTLGAS